MIMFNLRSVIQYPVKSRALVTRLRDATVLIQNWALCAVHDNADERGAGDRVVNAWGERRGQTDEGGLTCT